MTKARAAVFCLGKDETFHLPQWLAYYGQHFVPEDMYVLDHDSHEPSVLETLDAFQGVGGNVRHLQHETVFDHPWLLEQVHAMQRELLGRYEYVAYTDTDELLIPEHGTLRQYLDEITLDAVRCTGYDIIEGQMYRYPFLDKTLLARIPLTWDYGYHSAEPNGIPRGLDMYHLHRLDFDQAWAKSLRWRQNQFDSEALTGGFSLQNHPMPIEAFRDWFGCTFGNPLVPWNDRLKEALTSIETGVR